MSLLFSWVMKMLGFSPASLLRGVRLFLFLPVIPTGGRALGGPQRGSRHYLSPPTSLGRPLILALTPALVIPSPPRRARHPSSSFAQRHDRWRPLGVRLCLCSAVPLGRHLGSPFLACVVADLHVGAFSGFFLCLSSRPEAALLADRSGGDRGTIYSHPHHWDEDRPPKKSRAQRPCGFCALFQLCRKVFKASRLNLE